MKKITSFVLVLLLTIGFSLSIKAEETFKVKEIFPNQKFATEIAKELGKNIDDEVSQSELDTITGATIVIGSANVDTIEGIGYLTNLKVLFYQDQILAKFQVK